MSTNVRTSNQSRASTKIVIGFIVLLALAYGGKTLWENMNLKGVALNPITPGRVNLVGIDTKKGGYHIVVSNGLAQLVQSPLGSFGPGDQAAPDESDTAQKRVPLKELIQTLQGNSAAVGPFVGVLNDFKQDDLPSVQVAWKSDDVEKAIKGDATLKKKLEEDLNTHLDGTPLPEFRRRTFDTGIVIHVPVTLNVTNTTGSHQVTGDLLMPFQTSLMKALFARVKDIHFTDHDLVGYYAEVGKDYIDKPNRRQDVAHALSQIISKENVSSMTALPQSVLDSVQILANDSMITHATLSSEDTDKGPIYNMDLTFTDLGRKRLWSFSKDNVGNQLLLVVDGVAVAAPRVQTELVGSTLSIKNLPDGRIAQDSTNKINGQQ